jgi:hypothetical protein
MKELYNLVYHVELGGSVNRYTTNATEEKTKPAVKQFFFAKKPGCMQLKNAFNAQANQYILPAGMRRYYHHRFFNGGRYATGYFPSGKSKI